MNRYLVNHHGMILKKNAINNPIIVAINESEVAVEDVFSPNL